MSKVAIEKANGNLMTAIAAVVDDLGVTVVAPGDRVLIKPNLVHIRGYGVNDMTSPAVIEAVSQYCLNCGAKQVIIGEGPGTYNPRSELKECLIRPGIPDMARKLGIDWVLFDDHGYRTFRNVSDCTPEVFRITEYAFDCDRLINLPVLKTHYLTKVTLAMKNLKGCLKYEDKPRFHSPDLERAIVELNKIVRPTFNIIDATWQTGNKKMLIAGEDIVAVDAVGCALMEIEPSEVRTVKLGKEAGLGEADVSRIDIVGADLKELKFKVKLPREQLSQAFPLLEITGTERACSGCIFPLVHSLQSAEKHDVKLKKPLRICVGKKPEIPKDKACLLVGDCTGTLHDKIDRIKGCPPERDALFNGIMEVMNKIA